MVAGVQPVVGVGCDSVVGWGCVALGASVIAEGLVPLLPFALWGLRNMVADWWEWRHLDREYRLFLEEEEAWNG